MKDGVETPTPPVIQRYGSRKPARDWPRLLRAVATAAVPDPHVEEHDTAPADVECEVVGESGFDVEPVSRRQVGVRTDVKFGRSHGGLDLDQRHQRNKSERRVLLDAALQLSNEERVDVRMPGGAGKKEQDRVWERWCQRNCACRRCAARIVVCCEAVNVCCDRVL